MSATAVKMRRTRATACQRRNNKHLPHRIEMLLGILFLVAVASLFTGYLTQSATFHVKRVLFEGAHILSETDILAAAGITSDDNIIFLDTLSTARRVEALPYVKRCEVKRMYPDEVLLRIIERKAVATIMVSNHLFEIDSEYVVLRELTPKALPTGPIITALPDIAALEPGVQIESEELAQALALWEEFRTLSFAKALTLSEIAAVHQNDLRMYFNELPYEIRWGRSPFKEQAARLEILWRELNGKLPCEYYLDLRFDADLVCK